MIATVLSIKQKDSDTFDIDMSLGAEEYRFVFTVERDAVDEKFLAIAEDPQFSKLFRFNDHIATNTIELVAKMINEKVVKLPVDVGDFGTCEQALAQQKPFDVSHSKHELNDNSYQFTASSTILMADQNHLPF